ncbi:MAG: hypothetical protein AB7U79_05970 [Candidatus Izemoplasmatales bacterium]
MYNVEEFTKQILGCKNINDIEEVIHHDKYSILVKAFDKEIVILRVFEEIDKNLSFKSMYFNMETKEVEVQHQIGKFVENFHNDFVKVVYNDGYFRFYFKTDFIEMNIFNFPEGDHYKMKVMNNGSFGGGCGWDKHSLGL